MLTVNPISFDSDLTTVNFQEVNVIDDVWQRVSEDYPPFDLDVTTETPSTFTITTGHVVITSHFEPDGGYLPFSANTGDAARINSFGTQNYVTWLSPA